MRTCRTSTRTDLPDLLALFNDIASLDLNCPEVKESAGETLPVINENQPAFIIHVRIS